MERNTYSPRLTSADREVRFAQKTASHLKDLPPYTPIEPFEVLSSRLGREPERIIKLDANENPYGPAAIVRQRLAEMPFPHIYPDPESRTLREALSHFSGVPFENLLVGSGADELIDLLLRVLLDPGDAILICPPTFGMYAFDAHLNAGRVLEVPRRPDFSLDVEAIRRMVLSERPKVLFLAVPNNPDGSMPPTEEINAVLELPVLVVLDEAYIEFADENLGFETTRLREILKRDNLVVLRTFSKWAGLAGLRVGYGAFPAWLLPTLWKAKQPYNLNVAASEAALASLEALEDLRSIIARLRAERERLWAEIARIPYLRPYPSQANFILCQVTGRDAAGLKEWLAREYGILVRYFNKPGLRDHIRISVGKPEETDLLLQALKMG